MDDFTTLKWEGRDISKVWRGDGGRNFIQDLSGEYVAEENMVSLHDIPTTGMGGPMINPDFPGDYGSDT